MSLGNHNGIEYTVVEPRHRDQVVEILTAALLDEPSTSGSVLPQPTEAQWRRFTEFFIEECTTNGLSVVALDPSDPTTVVGAFINRDFLQPLPVGFEEFVAEPSPFAPILAALTRIDEAWFESHPEIPQTEVGRVVDLWMVGVSGKYLGRKIASVLTELSMKRVAEAGFEFAVIEATGDYSGRMMKAKGCRAVAELAYKDFLWHGEAVFAQVPPPHTKWVIYEKALRETGE